MKTITLPVKVRLFADTLSTDHVLVYGNGRIPGRFGVGAVPSGQSARQVDRGPLVEGPWAYTFPLCTVIAADPDQGTFGDMRRLREAGKVHEVQDGDRVTIDGVVYEVGPDPRNRQYPILIRLQRVEAAPAATYEELLEVVTFLAEWWNANDGQAGPFGATLFSDDQTLRQAVEDLVLRAKTSRSDLSQGFEGVGVDSRYSGSGQL